MLVYKITDLYMTTFNYSIFENIKNKIPQTKIGKIIDVVFYCAAVFFLIIMCVQVLFLFISNKTVFLWGGVVMELMYLFLVTSIGRMVYYGSQERKRQIFAFQEFANSNHIIYKEKPDKELLTSHVFSLGDTRYFKDYFVFFDQKSSLPSFQFFNYDYSVSKGKTSLIHSFRILIIELRKNVPHIYVHYHDNSELPVPFTEDQGLRLNVNHEYEKNITCYVTKGDEVDALQIFDYSLVETFAKTIPLCDFEFKNQQIFIYLPPGEVMTLCFDLNIFKKNFEEMITIYEQLNEPLKKTMSTFSFEVSPLDTTVVLKKGFW